MTDEILKARIEDTYLLSIKTDSPKFFGFLSVEQKSFAEKILSNIKCNFSFFGGFDDSQRVVLCCYPQWCENIVFPISSISIIYSKKYNLTHRDFLGTLMGLGIKREVIGDILIEDGRAVVFCLNEIIDYILEQIKKVGNVGVELLKGFTSPLPQGSKLVEFSTTVASNRLDCVISALISCSRNDALKKLSLNFVSVNSVITDKATKPVLKDDVISIKGYGKYIISSINDKTRKDRIKLFYKKYI